MAALARLRAYFLGLGEASLTPRGLALWGAALVESGQYERAILAMHEHLQSWPDHAPLHFEAGRAAQAKGLLDQARARFAHAVSLAPESPTYRFALAYALHSATSGPPAHGATHPTTREAAATQYRKVLEYAPDEPRVLFNLAVLERDLGRTDASLIHLERLVRNRPKDGRAWYTLGIVHYERRDYPPAQVSFERALKCHPKHARSLYQMGATLLALHRAEAAVPWLERALKMRPGFAAAHFALGRALGEKDAARAMKHLRESVLVDEPVRAAHVEMARLHERAGRYSEAAGELRLYLRYHPEEPEDASSRRHLRRIEGVLASRQADFGGLP